MLHDPNRESEILFSLDKPSLKGLSYALRHPETWPEGFYWDFNDCEQCAMGLAHQLWNFIEFKNDDNDNDRAVSAMARKFAMPYKTADEIFMGSGNWNKDFLGREKPFGSITPEQIADQIDKYLANQK